MTGRKALSLCLRVLGFALAGAVATFLGLSLFFGIRNEVATYSCRADDPRVQSEYQAIDFVKAHWDPDLRFRQAIAGTPEYADPRSHMNTDNGWKVWSEKKYDRTVWTVRFDYNRITKIVQFTDCGHFIEDLTVG